MSDAHRNYLFDLGYELKQDALDARRERDSAAEGSEERAFKSGRLLAFYEIISTMRNRAEGFGIPLSDPPVRVPPKYFPNCPIFGHLNH